MSRRVRRGAGYGPTALMSQLLKSNGWPNLDRKRVTGQELPTFARLREPMAIGVISEPFDLTGLVSWAVESLRSWSQARMARNELAERRMFPQGRWPCGPAAAPQEGT